jgi:hypothetical protein
MLLQFTDHPIDLVSWESFDLEGKTPFRGIDEKMLHSRRPRGRSLSQIGAEGGSLSLEQGHCALSVSLGSPRGTSVPQ